MTVFLTGASGGIGSSIKSALLNAGVHVISPTSSEMNLAENFNVDQYPELDGFIHCAGVNLLKNHSNIDMTELNYLFNINTFSFVKLCNQLTFKNGSNIIAIGSVYASLTKENRLQYTMSKHALHGAVKTIALEKALCSIKVNMVSPGFVDTNLTKQNNTAERIEFLNSNIPLGLVDPLQISNFCLYLIQHNKSITGQNINIDGGYTLKGL